MVRLYRSLLWFYPAEFRDEYGRELCLMLTDQLRSERSPAVRLWTWLAAVLALVIEGFSERCRLLADDLRATVRGLRKSPGLAAAAIAIFALGIGSTTTVFTLVNGLLLRPLPYPDHGRLAYVSESKNGRLFGSIAFPNYLDFRARNRSFRTSASTPRAAPFCDPKADPSACPPPASRLAS